MTVEQICKAAKEQSFELAVLETEKKNAILRAIARSIRAAKDDILQANAYDLAHADGLSESMKDRLALNDKRIEAMAQGVDDVAALPDPIGQVTAEWTRPNGLKISKVRVPLGVIGVIYEARPNVTADVAALCLKSGNAVVLRGGKEAIESNKRIYRAIAEAIEGEGFSAAAVGFIDDVSREGSAQLLKQDGYVDVVIPRGGDGLKKFVLANATMPVIASAGGNCHLYVDKTADTDMAVDVVCNAKLSRPSTCNALEQLLVDREIAAAFLPKVCGALLEKGCRLTGSAEAKEIVPEIALAEDEDYRKEHHDKELTIFVVGGEEEAIARINANGTCHSDGIITRDEAAADYFARKVDSGCVYINASTRFTDGFEFGFGAEIGISTQKLHARGPLGPEQLTSEKYVVRGEGQIRI